jgi:hypothetical protein
LKFLPSTVTYSPIVPLTSAVIDGLEEALIVRPEMLTVSPFLRFRMIPEPCEASGTVTPMDVAD